MKLSLILGNEPYLKIVGNPDKEVSQLYEDSRDITQQDSLYFAVKGLVYDGHDFIDEAIQKGAGVIICEQLPSTLDARVSYVLFETLRPSIGKMASRFYDNPSQKLKLIGVTGTNGKTSVVDALYQSLQNIAKKTLLLSTAGDYFNGEAISFDRKNPSSVSVLKLHKLISEYYQSGAEYVLLEVTSHALDQYRVSGIDFDIAVFTNLSQDHLDYHKTMEHYATSKKKFFDLLDESASAVICADDSYAAFMVEDTKARIFNYGSKNPMSLDYAYHIEAMSVEGSRFNINGLALHIQHIGDFNIANMTAVFACLDILNIPRETIRTMFQKLKPTSGRLEIIKSSSGITGVVDYAHSPDALENVLQTLKIIPHRKLILIFGCGGDRDSSKRPLMAKVAEDLADIIILTSDNPRTEDPLDIITDIEQGFTKSATGHALIENREEAIRRASMIAQQGDIILLAGKGHEDYQIIGTKKYPFSDKLILERYLHNRKHI